MKPIRATQTRAQSLTISSGTGNDTSRTLFQPNYWTEIAANLKHESRSGRLDCLEHVSGIIQSAIDANPQIPSDLLKEAQQMTLTLKSAEFDRHADMDELESGLIDSFHQIVTYLPKENPNVKLTIYGGTFGNEIFKLVTHQVVIPLLTSHLSELAKHTSELSHSDAIAATTAFLRAFLDLAGNERGKIARITASKFSEHFGIAHGENGQMIDNLGKSPWYGLISGKINALMESAWKEILVKNPDAQPWDSLPECSSSSDSSWRMKLHSEGSTTLCLIAYSDGHRTGTLMASGVPARQKVLFDFKWSIEVEQEDDGFGDFVISELKCKHIPMQEGALEASIAPQFFEALQPATPPQRLHFLLASIFYDLVRSSRFARGLASISEWAIQSIATRHGYTLEFSPEWQAPEHPAPDQQALSETDRDAFIQSARTHLILKPIPPSSPVIGDF